MINPEYYVLVYFVNLDFISGIPDNQHFSCDRCGKIYRYSTNLKRHKTYECGVPPKVFCTFQGCTFKTNYKSTLKTHMRTKHNEIMNLR